MGASWAYRSSTHLRSNPLYTRLIKIILATFLIAPVHLKSRLLFFLSCSSFAFSSMKLTLIAQQVLPVQTGLYRYDERMVQEINDENLMLTQLNVS